MQLSIMENRIKRLAFEEERSRKLADLASDKATKMLQARQRHQNVSRPFCVLTLLCRNSLISLDFTSNEWSSKKGKNRRTLRNASKDRKTSKWDRNNYSTRTKKQSKGSKQWSRISQKLNLIRKNSSWMPTNNARWLRCVRGTKT